MEEINALPYNGLTAISTFSGCGGSSLGYRMAGIKVLYANEFISAAQEVYKANFPDTILDGRDIRDVMATDILDQIGMSKGELDILDGSPPCDSFSTAGKRSATWGKKKKYHDTIQRTDDLFEEYIRLLQGLKPKVFIAENVSGLIKGVSKGYFKFLLREFKSSGYKVRAVLLNAAWLGVPQTRRRIIFIGVRNDLNQLPVYPKPFSYQYTLKDACPWIDRARHNTHENPSFSAGDFTNKPCQTILSGSTRHHYEIYGPTKEECDAMSFEGMSIDAKWEKLRLGESHKERFNLVKAHPDRPCPTILGLGGTKGVASVTHPFEKRKFTISELKLLSSFPEDFILTGSLTEQWSRIGLSVPPFMVMEIAKTIRDKIFKLHTTTETV